MNLSRLVRLGVMSVGVLAAAPAAVAQPSLENFRFDPPRVCARGTFRWEVSYRGLPGGLAAAREVSMEGRWDGPDERSGRSRVTPAKDDLQLFTAEQGRFESRLVHAGPARRGTPGDADLRYTLRVVLADGQEVVATTAVRYVDGCPPPARHTTLASGPTGRIGLETATPTIPEFLKGIRPPRTDVIWGDLELAPGAAERSPAILVVHRSGGIGDREDRWADELRRAGAATFVVDSFTGRNIAMTGQDQSQLSSLAMTGDAYRALELLATHPRIDPARIGVMGFSKGGAVALYSAITRFQRMHGPGGAGFALHIPFYPPCYYAFVDDEAVTDRPIRLFHGTADDVAPVGLCRDYVERLRKAGADARITVYAGAHHQFERPDDGPPRRSRDEQNASRCFWEERPAGELVGRTSGLAFGLHDPCVTRGATFGSDPAAYRDALQAVKTLVGAGARPSP
jgi:dienelactone hydrolase